ncbi:MAG TPA: hypothetical protein VGQ27_14095, partial [Steroidobacteraceae bacterium]|nr:hypothetical protein [Steroidobacteraceae bacterium]
GVNFSRIVKMSQDDYSKLADTVNSDAARTAATLREEWLGATCQSADDLEGQLLIAFTDKVRPYTDDANPAERQRHGRVGSELGHVMATAMILAREVDPDVDSRAIAIIKRAGADAAPFAIPAKSVTERAVN